MRQYLTFRNICVFRRQQGKRTNLKTAVTRKQSTPNFPKNEQLLPSIRTCMCAYHGVINVRFSKNLACFVFFENLFWDFSFCLITADLFVLLLLFTYLISFSNLGDQIHYYWHEILKSIIVGLLSFSPYHRFASSIIIL